MKKLTALLLSFLLILCACQQPKPEPDLSKFAIADRQLYTQDRKECLTYKMVFYSEPTDDELFAAIKAVLNDGYFLHTMWFYPADQAETLSSPFAKIHEDADKLLTLKKADGSIEQRSGKELGDYTLSLAVWLFLFLLLFPVWVPLLGVFLAIRRRQNHPPKRPIDIDHPGQQQDIPLASLQSLLEGGLITQEEFDERKQRL